MSIAPSFCTAVSRSLKNCFRRRAKAKVHEAVSSSRLSPEMEARVQGLPVMSRAKCRKVLEGQDPKTQWEQISLWEQLPDLTKTSTWPPASTIIKELVTIPTLVVEPELNLDFCQNWFKDDRYADEEEEEEFDDDASLCWIPAEWPREHVLPRTDIPQILRQVPVFSVAVENAPVITEHTTLPSPPSPPLSPILSPHIVKPLQRAARTKGHNGISRESARSAIPSPVFLQPSRPKKTASRTSVSGQGISPSTQHFDRKPLGKRILPLIQLEEDSRKLQGVSYDDFAQELDKPHKIFNGTSALEQLPILVHPARPASTQRKVVWSSTRPTYLPGRSTSSKENWQQVEAPPPRKHIPTTLDVVSPRVEDAEFQWCHLAVDISYGTFANGLDERRMIIDDAFVTQDWD